jgi:transposase
MPMGPVRKETSDVDCQKIVDSYTDGKRVIDICEHLNLSCGAVYSVLRIYSQENRVIKNRRGGLRPKKPTNEQQSTLWSWIDEDCSKTLLSLRDKCLQEFAVDLSEKTLDRYLHSFHYTIKRASIQPIRHNTDDVIAEQATYAIHFMETLAQVDDQKSFFLDEVGFSVAMCLCHVQALAGQMAVHGVSGLCTWNIFVLAAMGKHQLQFFKSQTQPFNSILFAGAMIVVLPSYQGLNY